MSKSSCFLYVDSNVNPFLENLPYFFNSESILELNSGIQYTQLKLHVLSIYTSTIVGDTIVAFIFVYYFPQGALFVVFNSVLEEYYKCIPNRIL